VGLTDLLVALLVASFFAIPISLTLWGVVDIARRPQWAWALAGRSQLAWMAATLFGAFTVLGGMLIALWYLGKVRPVIAAAEEGRFEA
jgi:hypothetical protein